MKRLLVSFLSILTVFVSANIAWADGIYILSQSYSIQSEWHYSVYNSSAHTHATLIDNGNNLIYDTRLNITWYDPPPTPMTWSQATAWAAGLTVGGTTAGSWSLPQTLPVNGSTNNYNYSTNGSTDVGYNISARGSAYPGSPGSEMAYLYYFELRNKGRYDVTGNPQSGWGLVNTGPFKNLLPDAYWSGTAYANVPVPGNAWVFDYFDGGQGSYAGYGNYALAVHPGDIGAPKGVPEPSTMLLLGSGLIGLIGLRRKFKK